MVWKTDKFESGGVSYSGESRLLWSMGYVEGYGCYIGHLKIISVRKIEVFRCYLMAMDMII